MKPNGHASSTSMAGQDWEATARMQAARGDYLEDLLRKVVDLLGVMERPEVDDLDDRAFCEGCDARGWASDGFYIADDVSFCAACAAPVPT